MSIAVYAVIKPSRLLFALICGMCAVIFGIGSIIGTGVVGELAPISRFLIGGACVFTAFSVLYQQARKRSEFHIHITGPGQILFAEMRAERSGKKDNAHLSTGVEKEAALSTSSTIWPWLMLLRLQLDNKAVITVPVLPDCVPADTFRALSAACRWLAAHDHSLKY